MTLGNDRCWMLAALVAFAAAYGQAPIFYSNQNQYYLHGFAAAGQGDLARDWLANTADPTPIFSGFVALVVRLGPLWVFYLCHGLLLMVYAAGLLGVYAFLNRGTRGWPMFLALVTLIHAAATRWLSYHLLGWDYPWYLQAGVAGQYTLGAMFQPSVFGVLLVAATALFLHDRLIPAGLAVAAAGTIHSTYVLPGAMLTCGFLAALLAERRVADALKLGAVTLAATLPIVVSVVLRFAPTSPETFASAQNIVVNIRIPHHCRVDLWLDPIAGMQIAWIVLGVALGMRRREFGAGLLKGKTSLLGLTVAEARKGRLAIVLGVSFILAAGLTLAQVATHSNTLAVLFPWRLSAILVPLATVIVVFQIVHRLRCTFATDIASAILLALLAALGLTIALGRFGYHTIDEELPLYQFVREHHAPGDCYLVPTKIPDLVKSTRGSSSSDFRPLAVKKTDTAIVPIDLQRFRLMTGVPIYVDFKAIPYRDADVVEWMDRQKEAKALQDGLDQDDIGEQLRKLGITHVIVPIDPARPRVVSPRSFTRVYHDDTYQIFRVE